MIKKAEIFLLFSLALFICSSGFAQSAKRQAAVKEAKGIVELKIGSDAWSAAKVGTLLNQGDSIRSKANSWAVIEILDLEGKERTASVELKPNSQLRLQEILENKEKQSQTTMLDLSLGEILIKAEKLDSEKSKFEVKTPTSVVGVRGTQFSVTVEAIE